MTQEKGYSTPEEAIEAWNTWRGRYIDPSPEDFRVINPCNACGDVIDEDGKYVPLPPHEMVGSVQMHENGAYTVPWPRVGLWQVKAAERLFPSDDAVSIVFSLRARWCALFPSVLEYRSEITQLLNRNDHNNVLINEHLKRWNKYLESNGFSVFEPNDLRGINLSGLNLSGANYSGVNLRHLDLSFSECSVARLDGANLYGSTFQAASGSNIHLKFAICGNADFSHASFSMAKLRGTDFSFSSFRNALFHNSSFDGARCRGADFSNGQFTDCSFSSTEIVDEDGTKHTRYADLRELKWNEATNFRGTLTDIIDPSKHNSLIRFIEEQRKSDGLSNQDTILRIIQSTGIAMERHPSTYQGKDEEALRDHILTVLASHFPQAAAETFNHLGKTDILIRQDGQNVFIGECKFWRGRKHHHDAIDQILGYLTWRDSRAAIIYFVRNRNLGPVLEEIDATTPDHRCYVETLGKTNDGWISFRFTLLEDRTRQTDLSILVFHFSE